MGAFTSLTSADGFTLAAYRAEPEGPVRGGVVVIQEIFGVNRHIQSVADRYAAAGYLAIAPALFDRAQRNVDLGYDAEDMAVGMGIASKQIDFALALADTVAAGKVAADAGRVGIVGYCFGGTITAAAAMNCGDTFSAAASYYGGGTAAIVGNGTPSMPTMVHYGALDAYIPPADVDKVRNAWPDAEVHVYDADHGFHCDARASFSPLAAGIAQARTFRLFAKHIG
jgi:carboxymethylenebutenolidase